MYIKKKKEETQAILGNLLIHLFFIHFKFPPLNVYKFNISSIPFVISSLCMALHVVLFFNIHFAGVGVGTSLVFSLLYPYFMSLIVLIMVSVIVYVYIYRNVYIVV